MIEIRRHLAGLGAAFALAATAAPSATAEPAPTRTAGQLTVGLSMPSEGFQVGVVNGGTVTYARGLEVDLAREIAKRLELAPEPVFTQNTFSMLVAPGAKSWDLALAQATITPARATHVDFSVPYLRADQGVLLSQYVRTTPTTISGLRKLRLCAERGTTAVQVVKTKIKPTAKPTWQPDEGTMLLALQLGRCDAVVSDLPVLATLKDRAPVRYGVLAGKISTGEQYGVVLPKGSVLTPRVNAAIEALTADGTLAQLQRTWLSVTLSNVRTLR